MSYLNFAEDIIINSKKLGADDCDVVLFENNSTSVDIRLKKLENVERSSSRAVGIRVFVGKKSAIVSSSSFLKEDIDNLVEKAVNMAKFATEDEYSGLADEQFYPENNVELDQYDETKPSIEWLQEKALETEYHATKDPQITNSEGSNVSYSKNLSLLCNSRGFSREYSFSSCSMSVSVIAGEEENMETDYEYSSKIFFSDLDSPQIIGEKAASRTIAKLNSQKIKTSKMPVIFEPRVAASIISCLIKSVNGAAIARGTSFLKDKLNQKIFADNINIIDDPFIIRGLNSRYFDAEAVATSKCNIIENGFLKNWLLDIRSSNKLQMRPTGHAARGLSSSPRPSASNVYLVKGQQTEQELIGSISQGVYITELFGMGVNLITGDYSQGATGFMIENGKIAYPISEFTIADNLATMFLNMSAADNLEFKKGINSPSIKIEQMTIAGN